ncbi:MAG: helix-turn-helix transcriptional regulator [Candidatus Nanohaloarchaea archaeon]
MLASTVSATSVASQSIRVDLADTSVHVDMEIQSLTSSRFSYVTSYPVRDLEVRLNGERVDCEVRDLKVGDEVLCDTELKDNISVQINYDSGGMVDSRQSVKIFRYSESVLRPTKNYSLQVVLPQGMTIADNQTIPQPVIEPAYGRAGSKGGKRIFVRWSAHPELGESLDFQLIYEGGSPEPESGGDPIWIGVLVGALLVGIAGFLFRRYFLMEDISNVYEDLAEDQTEILDVILDADGEILQKDVVERSQYSKAKVSGTVSELVEEGIVEKEKEGRSNKLTIAGRYRY